MHEELKHLRSVLDRAEVENDSVLKDQTKVSINSLKSEIDNSKFSVMIGNCQSIKLVIKVIRKPFYGRNKISNHIFSKLKQIVD